MKIKLSEDTINLITKHLDEWLDTQQLHLITVSDCEKAIALAKAMGELKDNNKKRNQ